MKRFNLLIVILSLLTTSALAEDAKEVAAAREAAKKHNEAIESAEERLERAIARAKAEQAKAVISAKERMIEDLRRAFRVAMRSDEPENSIKIADQIKRLEKQVARLKEKSNPQVVESKKPEVTVKLNGLDPRLVGVIYMHGTTKTGVPYGRAHAISPEGKLRVLYDLAGTGDGIDVGSIYQGEIRGDKFVVHFSDWTLKGATNGRTQCFAVTAGGKLEVHNGRFEDFKRNAHFTFFFDYKQSHFESVDAFKTFIQGDEKNHDKENPAEVPDVDKPAADSNDSVDDKSDSDSVDDEVDFFGIPLK